MVQQRMERFRQKQMKLEELTQLGWADAADYFRERYIKYGTSELRVVAIVQQQGDNGAAAPAPTSFRKHMESLAIVPRISPMPQGTSRPGNSHIRLRLVKPHSDMSISGLEPTTERDMSPLPKAKPVEPVSIYPFIEIPANHHIEFGLGRRHGDGSCVSRGIVRKCVIFDVISW